MQTTRLARLYRLVGGLLALAWQAAMATPPVVAAETEIIFGTPPTQTVERTQEIYGPLAGYLSEASGARVRLAPARSFLEYTKEMRKGTYDLVFDGPHFVSWRMERLDHEPIARLPGELVFVLAVRDGSPLRDTVELVGKKICGLASPNLATLSVLDMFQNPVRQPIIVPVSSFKAALECLRDQRAVAAIMPIKFWRRWQKSGEAQGMRLLTTTEARPLPPRTFSISRRIPQQQRDYIAQALLNSAGKAGAQPLLKRFRTESFVVADPKQYEGLSRLLLPVWGFHD